MKRPRVASLLPSATEIVCALGAREQLVGVSHECDHPEDVGSLPRLTSAKCLASGPSREIDRSVREIVKDALGVYDVDVARLRQVDPDVIVTQDLCDVCAVSFDDVKRAVSELTRDDVAIVNLSPLRLADIFEDVRRVGLGIGREREAEALRDALLARVENVRKRAATARSKPRVVTIEWLEPVMLGATWMPELIEIAGGTPLGTHAGERAPTLDRAALEALAPDVVVIKPCGFPLERTLAELDVVREVLPWDRWPACRSGEVWLADGNAYFNRPGPRIVDSLEILAGLIQPALFPEMRERYAAAIRRVSS